MGTFFGNPLIVANLSRRLATERLSDIPHARLQREVEKMLLNPQKYADELKKLKSAKNFEDYLVTRVLQTQTLDEENR